MWECAIEGCGHRTDAAEDLLLHQATDHDRVRCGVCGTTIADGFFALHHAFDEHTRTEYLRAYDADSSDVTYRESVLEAVQREADVESVLAELRARENVDGDVQAE